MAKEGTADFVRKWASHFFFEEVDPRNKIRKSLLYFARLVIHICQEFTRDLCPQKASALAYTTILSFVPVTALFVLYFKMAGKLEAFSSTIRSWIVETFVAESAQSVTVYIDQFVRNIHTGALGALGATGLIFTTYLLFRTIERSLNDIWKIRTHRTFISRFQILASLLILVPTFLVASIYVSGKFQELMIVHGKESFSVFSRTMFLATPFILTTLSFFMIFKLLPNTRVQFKPAAISALFASLLFETAKSGFNFYVIHVISASKIYGALGLFPVFLLWIYLSWLIILLGVEISYTIQNFRTLHNQAVLRRAVGPLDVAIHEEWGLRIAIALARRFAKGEGLITKEDLAKDVGLKPHHVEDHLMMMSKARIVASVENEEEYGYVFTKPTEQLLVGDILRVFREELGLSSKKDLNSDKSLDKFLR